MQVSRVSLQGHRVDGVVNMGLWMMEPLVMVHVCGSCGSCDRGGHLEAVGRAMRQDGSMT